MSHNGMKDRYVVISPAKDEEKRIETTIQSLLRQTIRPVRWVIVDDGSQDRTWEILQSYAQQYDWIHAHRVVRDNKRKLGSAEIRAFTVGFELVKDLQFDFVVKLDTDLEFSPDYFESLLAKFHTDDRLGIASGNLLENYSNGWTVSPMPPYHAAGASKVVRSECFKEIGGFPMYPGWDTVDEIKAQFKGWGTRHFQDVLLYHLRAECSASGFLRTNVLHGEVYYACGGGPFFFLIKVLHRLVVGRPIVIGGLGLLWGYLKPLLMGRKRLVSAAEARCYRRVLNKRIWERLTRDLMKRESTAQDGLVI
jgi:poly-beta-1,6-N-acetyl-D-glucosamine synthase